MACGAQLRPFTRTDRPLTDRTVCCIYADTGGGAWPRRTSSSRPLRFRTVANASSSNDRDGPGRRRRRYGKASKPGMFEVEEVSPPPHSLGIHSLPPKTHNGDQLSIEGKEYVVTSLILQYKLQRGRYVREHCKLQVLPTGRYFYNEFLSAMMEMTPDDKETGKQD